MSSSPKTTDIDKSYTPGPWEVCGANNDNCQCGLIWSITADCVVAQSVSRENEQITCGEGVSRDEANLNGKLIAAAPDLLEACKAALERFNFYSYPEVKMLYKAIQKAESHSK